MKKNILVMAFAMTISTFVFAQETRNVDSVNKEPNNLGEVFVYANKFPESLKKIAQTVKVIIDKNALNNQPNAGDVLLNSGAVFVQKSQQGGSSPIIRGFEASRVLLMVDGVRMNNAIYRSGHLQNIITVDNAILDRMEVIYGPSSTIYGSDALGGVVNMFTKNPVLSKSGKIQTTGNTLVRYATATEEIKEHIDFNIASGKWASLTSITNGVFGDVIQGANRQSAYPNFGLKPFFVQRVANSDSAFVNQNPNKQIASDYMQLDITQKILFQPNEHTQHLINIQIGNSSNVQRYDRLTEVAGGAPVYAEWYYGPQIKNLASYQYSDSKMQGFFQELKIIASFQDIEESRITRRFKNNNKDSRWERVNVWGFNADAKHYSGKNELHFGLESYTNYVSSTAERLNVNTGILSRIATRYSDGPTKMSSNAIYGQHTFKINDVWTLNEGLRLNLVRLDARFADTTLMHFPFVRAEQNNLAVTGNLGLVYATPKNFRIAFLLGSGFRSPNVDDLTKVFDTKTGYVVVPNKDLKPEYTYNAEVNFNQMMDQFSFGGSLFYTLFRNAIVVDKAQFNGQDSIMYQGVKSAVYSPQNKAKANVFGFSLNATYKFDKQTSLDAVYTYTKGTYKNAGVSIPLDHIPPTYGKVALKHKRDIWLVEGYSLFNGWKKMADYNLNGEDNQQYATSDGMPSWFTLNVRGEINFGKKLAAQMQVENILDRNYRYFASGISAPGRNFVFSIKASF
ncbi:MAG: TonB-dependent receptor [Bacteroidota bacterium]